MPRRSLHPRTHERRRLAETVARELSPTLGDAAARAEARAVLDALRRALGKGPAGRVVETVRAAASGWLARGVASEAVGRALFALLRLGRPGGQRTVAPPPAGVHQHPREKFDALLTVSHAVVNSLDLDTILATIARQAREVIQVDECTVFLHDEPRGELWPAACDIESFRDEVMAFRLKLGEGITGHVALTGRGEIVNEALADPRAVQVPGTPEEHSSLLCVPLIAREKVVGVITMVRTAAGHDFHDEDLDLATLFAGQCSAAIVNARAYEGMRRAYEELRETRTQLVQSAKLNALGEMAGGVAHDFNNILAAILGRTQLLLQRVDDPEVCRELAVIEQAAVDGAQAVRRVQEFTRVRQDAHFEIIELNAVILDVLELTRAAWESGAKRRGVTVTVDLDLSARAPIAGNASELREVFTNLVLNAVDAMPYGGLLALRTMDVAGEVHASVRDTGIGMDAETRRRVFDPFFTTKSIKGTGLGLSVASGIVARHSGTIVVESEPERGTEFVVRLPICGVPEAVAPVPAEAPPPAFRILVVDDEEPVLQVMQDMLRVLGQEVSTAMGGPAGLEAFATQPFDVVFTDLGMPEINGYDLTRAIRAVRPETVVVLVTGWGVQLEGTAAQSGVDTVLPKPFTLDDVERVLRFAATRVPSARRAA